MAKHKIVNFDDNIIATVQAHLESPEGNALLVQLAGAAIMTGANVGEKGLRVFIGPTDPISDLPVFIDLGQHQVHEGEAHIAHYKNAALGTNTVDFLLTVPVFANTIQAPHFRFSALIYNGSADTFLYEGPTASGGSSLPSYNRNRNSLIVPGMTITQGVTTTVTGTLLEPQFVGAGSKGTGDAAAADEWVLKSNTQYLFRITGRSAGTEAILHFEWYEDLGV